MKISKVFTYISIIALLLFCLGLYYRFKTAVNQNLNSIDKEDKQKMKTADLKLQFTTDIEAEEYYYETITKNTFTCDSSVRIGRKDDGGWDICTIKSFELKTFNCLSYSFGINDIWEFDDTIAQKYKCLVRTFDPSMKSYPDEMQRPSKVLFYKIGLGKEDTKWSNGWKIMKMSSFLKKFNEEKKVIDILKIDIEYSEWDAFESMIQDGVLSKVKQLMIETHTAEVQNRETTMNEFVRYLRILNELYRAGFQQWKHHFNHFGKYDSKRSKLQRTCCYEHYFVNTNYL